MVRAAQLREAKSVNVFGTTLAVMEMWSHASTIQVLLAKIQAPICSRVFKAKAIVVITI